MSFIAKKLVVGSTLRTISLFSTIAVSFFLMPFIVHTLGDRMYGFWAVIGAVIGYYGVLDFGLSAAVSRYIAGSVGKNDIEGCNEVFSNSILINSWLGLLGFVVTVLIALFANLIVANPEDAKLFSLIILILGSGIAITFPARGYTGVLEAHLRQDITSIIQIFAMLLRSLLIFVVLNLGYSILAMALVTSGTSIFTMILNIYFAKKCLPELKFDRKYLKADSRKKLFSYSFYAFITQVTDQLKSNADKLVITGFIGLSAVTHFNIAVVLVLYFKNLIVGLLGSLQHLFSRQYDSDEREKLEKTFFFGTKLAVFFAYFIGFGFIAWGEPFIERWMGVEYVDSYPCLVVLVVGWVMAISQYPSNTLMFGISKHKYYAYINTLEGVANLVLSLVLVQEYGILGVAIGTCVPMFINKTIIQPIYLAKASGIRYWLYISRYLKSVFIAFISLIVPAVFSYYYATPNYSSLMICGLVSGVFYLLGVLVLGLNKEERKYFQKVLLSR